MARYAIPHQRCLLAPESLAGLQVSCWELKYGGQTELLQLVAVVAELPPQELQGFVAALLAVLLRLRATGLHLPLQNLLP